MGRPTGSQGVKRLVFRVPGGHGVGKQRLRGSRGRQTEPKGVEGLAYRVPRGQRHSWGSMGYRYICNISHQINIGIYAFTYLIQIFLGD